LPSWPGSAPRARGGGVSQSSGLLLGRNRVPARQARYSVDLVDAHLAHTRLWRGFFGDPQGEWALAPPPVPREGLPPKAPGKKQGRIPTGGLYPPWEGADAGPHVRAYHRVRAGLAPRGGYRRGWEPSDPDDFSPRFPAVPRLRPHPATSTLISFACHRKTRSPRAATPSSRTQRPTSDLAPVHSRQGQPPNYPVPSRDMGGGSPPALGSRRIG